VFDPDFFHDLFLSRVGFFVLSLLAFLV
jgi:hypothetical protein